MNKAAMKTNAQSYARAALASAAALWMSGITDPKILANAFVAAFLAPLLKTLEKPAK